MRWRVLAIALLVVMLSISLLAQNSKIEISLPTDNDALFRGGGPDFYQYIERDFHGEKSTPWEGGRYGFVRNPVPTAQGLVYTRFHEGIDIRCLHRDARGEPLDDVRAIADGKVVHTNQVPGYSNYGRYIVIEHDWDGSPYYSLYGHLSEIVVSVGQRLNRGERIARMGHTGEGLNQARAHVHLELNLMLSRQFESWYATFFPNEPNHHGLYNGLNLAGIDIARLYLALQKRPALTIPEFLAEEETLYRVLLPASRNFDLPKFYPWMLRDKEAGDQASSEVSINRAGGPLKSQAGAKAGLEPELSYLKPSGIDGGTLTMDRIAGRGKNAHLTEKGKQFMRLLGWP